MQLHAYRKLNILMCIMGISILVLLACCFLFFRGNRNVLIGSIIVVFLEVMAFPILEQKLPQQEIQEAVQQGRIALLQIASMTPGKVVHDASFHKIQIMKIEGTIITQSFQEKHVTFEDRFCEHPSIVQSGSVYVVYDENDPDCIALIPTVMLMQVLKVEPIVTAYEQHKGLEICYRNVGYRSGFFIEEMQDMIRKAG